MVQVYSTIIKYVEKLKNLASSHRTHNRNAAASTRHSKHCQKCSKIRKSSTTYTLREEEDEFRPGFYRQHHNQLWKQAFIHAAR